MADEPDLSTIASDPTTPPSSLADLAYDHPELRVAIARNPATYEGLRQWLYGLGDPDVTAALGAGIEPPAETSPGDNSSQSVPMDLSRYEIPEDARNLRAYADEQPEPELYIDGAGGFTTDRARAVIPSTIVSEPERRVAEQRILEPYKPSGDTTFSNLDGFYIGQAAVRKRQDHSAEPSRPRVSPSTNGQPFAVLQPTNAFAIIALVCALIGGSALAIVFGHVARAQIRRTGERGDGIAIAALVIGYLALVASIVILIISLTTASQIAGRL